MNVFLALLYVGPALFFFSEGRLERMGTEVPT
jgi:hypothetical protein